MKFLKKYASRKFLMAVAGFVMGCVAFFGLDENIIGQLAGAVTTILSVMSFIIGEAKVDAAAVFPDVVECVEVAEDKE